MDFPSVEPTPALNELAALSEEHSDLSGGQPVERKVLVRERRHSYIDGDHTVGELPVSAMHALCREKRHSYIGGDQAEDGANPAVDTAGQR